MSDTLERLKKMWTDEGSIGLSVLHYVKEEKNAFFNLDLENGKEVFNYHNEGPKWFIEQGPWPHGKPDCVIRYADYRVLDELGKAKDHDDFLAIYSRMVKERRIKIDVTSSLINIAGKGYVVFGKKVGAL
ncbi:MAG: hypothetical protein SV686_11545 [Thermodesulfobacteriota bacterium]|nr:hypothetical protein [Thermodesulfobacteriota bacterium]